MFNFADKVVIVTGACRGLGRAYTLALAARGAKVVAVDNCSDTVGEGKDVACFSDLDETVHDMGAELIQYQQDVTDYPAMERVVAEVLERFGRIDGLICNAGLMLPQSGVLDDLDHYRRQMEVNYFAPMRMIQLVVPHMKAQQQGHIIVTSGLSPAYGEKRLIGYGASAAAMSGVVRSIKEELEDSGVKINAIIPSHFSRQSEQLNLPYSFESMTPDLVVPAALYLLSGEAPNGEILTAGGGYYSRFNLMEEDGFALEPSDQRPQIVAREMKRLYSRSPRQPQFSSFMNRMRYVLKLLIQKRS